MVTKKSMMKTHTQKPSDPAQVKMGLLSPELAVKRGMQERSDSSGSGALPSHSGSDFVLRYWRRGGGGEGVGLPTARRMASVLVLVLVLLSQSLNVQAQGTAFTYDGRLNAGGAPANGIYDIRAGLYTTNTGGTVFAGPITNSAVAVSNGLFTITLDYGDVFDGTTYWLQVAVRTNGVGGFTVLSPRQQLTPTPYAIFAEGANAAGLSGTVPSASLAGGYSAAVSFTNPANIFAGNGSSLSNVNASTLGGLAPSNFWKTTGNAGTTPGLNFAGTTDTNAFELHVSSTRILRVEPDTRGLNAGNLIGGHPANGVMQPGSGGNAIAGGGFSGGGNIIGTNSSGVFIGAGSLNQAGPSVNDSVIAGGFGNTNGSPDSAIGGGLNNWIQPSSQYSVIGGGSHNLVSDYYPIFGGFATNNTAFYATVAGGISNSANAPGAFVGGGGYDGVNFGGNSARGPGSTVGGGIFNIALGQDSFVGGGSGNVSGPFSTVGGGQYNGAGGQWATVAGGQGNAAENWSAVGGGQGNFAGGILASNCTVGGGQGNFAGGSGYDNYATIAGGASNSASGSGSFIGGGGTDGSQYLGNTVNGNASVIGGGLGNLNNGYASTIGGGFDNTANSSSSGFFYGGATVSGGSGNKATADFATVAGGLFNTASGVGSFAAGELAQTTHTGTFIWGDGSQGFTGENVDYAFNVLASGGVYFYNGTNGLHIDGFGNNDGTLDYGLKFGGALSSGEGIASKRTAGGNQFGLDFYTSSSDRMSIAVNGFVGINTTSPSQRLEVNGDYILIDGHNANDGNGPIDAYIGGNGSGSDVQIGSMNSLITGIGFWNTAAGAWMHIACSSITINGGADVAEPFPITAATSEIAPGSVVVIDEANPGQLKLSEQAYDPHVAGVVSGANGINPGIQMQQEGLLAGGKNVALTGRVYVQADTSNGPIKPGDLLTTSRLPGRAMRVTNHARAQGAILGKAMTGLSDGQGMVLVLVTLQ